MYRYRPIDPDSEARYIEDLCDRIEQGLDGGEMPIDAYQDDRVFRAEMERVFTRSWVFIAHETEIPNSGDFVTRRIGLDQVIVTRTGKGEVHVMLNHCRHRGTSICAEDSGNATHFRCPYHGWTYKNNGDFVGAPEMSMAYGKRPDSKEWGLIKAPRVETTHGFIFACLSPNGPDLEEYLAGAGWMFDVLFGLHPDGMRVLAPPERFIIRSDWKSGSENFSGDSYHVGTAHYSATLSGFAAGDLRNNGDRADGFLFDNGHSFVGHNLPEWFGPEFAFWGYPPELREQMDLSNLDETQKWLLTSLPPTIGTIFPNFSFVRFPSPASPGEFPMAYTDVRVWQPIEPGVMEMWHWQLEYAFMPEDYQRQSYVAGQFAFGAGGMIEQDDSVLWEGVARLARSPWARRDAIPMHFKQKRSEPDLEWKGPGRHYTTTYGEYMQEGFWRRWVKDMRASVTEVHND
ncbi:Rieske 2Fe-2S domain-containing protein (plasmid) [Novosphingobium resinovorum]|uniref:aromatic ring-hydroxylating oxygenase subunit alpha n=1 Tax=Novosphingobium TaxID=165696 RepID=UPI001B3CA037|nr:MULTISPECIES: Rieske 2Fe-2S domain-containing protein [Novosphingobium]MBF7015295.1 Rieske 2Fe-2S domain-containing protein [Novosphingobium sp. HR1a]WJM29973.1 Rieske 2Fe-2S domain-containing protein [Novosphingobium resinovorum]